jgi:hypothetical protein
MLAAGVPPQEQTPWHKRKRLSKSARIVLFA